MTATPRGASVNRRGFLLGLLGGLFARRGAVGATVDITITVVRPGAAGAALRYGAGFAPGAAAVGSDAANSWPDGTVRWCEVLGYGG
jgi:hypothetical protein